MNIEPLQPDLLKILKKYQLEAKFSKQIKKLEKDILDKSLNLEKLVPHQLGLYSFRIDLKYRAICVIESDTLEIIDINNHYR